MAAAHPASYDLFFSAKERGKKKKGGEESGTAQTARQQNVHLE